MSRKEGVREGKSENGSERRRHRRKGVGEGVIETGKERRRQGRSYGCSEV